MSHFDLPVQWFRGFDLLIDIFSIIAVLLIALASYKYYRINRDQKYGHLALSFFVIASSFLLKALSYSLMYYYKIIQLDEITLVVKVVETPIQGIRPSFILFTMTLFLYRFLHLIGLYMLYYVYKRKYQRPDILIAVASIFLITYFSHQSWFAFHTLAFVLLGILVSHYYKLYMKNKRKNTKVLVMSFSIIALSQAIFVFSQIDSILYVYAEIVQLIGYLLLLTTFIMIIYNGKKKKQD